MRTREQPNQLQELLGFGVFSTLIIGGAIYEQLKHAYYHMRGIDHVEEADIVAHYKRARE